MAEIRAVIGFTLAAFAVWMTVQMVNRADRWDWIARSMRPVILKLLIGYFVVSTLSLPFKDRFWFGEFPLVALTQVPKLTLAHWCRSEVVMRGIRLAGLSKGSVSPDSIAARPWGLLLAYVLIAVPIFSILWYCTRLAGPYGRLACILAAAIVVDFIVTLLLAGGPGLSFY